MLQMAAMLPDVKPDTVPVVSLSIAVMFVAYFLYTSLFLYANFSPAVSVLLAIYEADKSKTSTLEMWGVGVVPLPVSPDPPTPAPLASVPVGVICAAGITGSANVVVIESEIAREFKTAFRVEIFSSRTSVNSPFEVNVVWAEVSKSVPSVGESVILNRFTPVDKLK